MAEKKKFTPEEAQTWFEQRETWCQTTLTKEQTFARKQRQHYAEQWESKIFKGVGEKKEPEPRIQSWNVEKKRPQMRHFQDKYECQFRY